MRTIPNTKQKLIISKWLTNTHWGSIHDTINHRGIMEETHRRLLGADQEDLHLPRRRFGEAKQVGRMIDQWRKGQRESKGLVI